MYQMKEQDKTPEKQLNEVKIGNLPEKEFRIMIVKMIQDLGKRMEAKIEKMQEMFIKDLEELKNKTKGQPTEFGENIYIGMSDKGQYLKHVKSSYNSISKNQPD